MHISRLALSFALFTTTVVATAACGSSSDEGVASSFSLEKSCTRTSCDASVAECGARCGKCLSACSSAGLSNCSDRCEASCDDNCAESHRRMCTEAEKNTCLDSTFKVTLPSAGDDEVVASCKRAVARHEACAESVTGPNFCEHAGRVVRTEVSKTYDCLAGLACGGEIASCDPAPTDLGDVICATIEKCGPKKCEAAFRNKVNALGGWLRDDVRDAVKTCDEDCTLAPRCLQTWFDAVDPPKK